MDYSKELPPVILQPTTTATETHHGDAVTIPESLLDAWAAWRCIEDDSEAYQVGENIARRMEEMNGQ